MIFFAVIHFLYREELRSSSSHSQSKELSYVFPIVYEKLVHFAVRNAKMLLNNASFRIGVVQSILLKSLDQRHFLKLAHSLNNHFFMRFLVILCIFFIHIPLSFWKPASPELLKSQGTQSDIAIIEGCVLFIELFTAITETLVLRHMLLMYTEIISTKIFEDPNDKESSLTQSIAVILQEKFSRNFKRQLALLLVLFIVLIDWILIMVFRFSIEHYFPIRIFIVMLMNSSMRGALVGFLKTIIRAKHEFILYFSNCLFAAITSLVLFRTFLNTDTINSSFTNIIRSITSSFVFFNTGANYSNLAFTAYNENPIYIFYFILLYILGNFVVLAFLLSSFVRSFQKEFQYEVLKKKQQSRSGIFAAFSCLDFNRSGKISKKILEEFYESVSRDDLLTDSSNLSKKETFAKGANKLEKFVESVEELNDQKLMRKYIFALSHFNSEESSKTSTENQSHSEVLINFQDRASKYRKKLFDFLAKKWVNNFITLLVIIQCSTLCFYGLDVVDEKLLDYINFAFVIIFAVELASKVISYGWRPFLSPTMYEFPGYKNLNQPEYEVINRLDFIAINLAVISNIIAILGTSSIYFSGSFTNWRFGMSFLVIRIFTQVPSTRRLIYPIFMSNVMKQFANLLFLLGIVIYVFAVYGTLVFGGKFNFAILQNDFPTGNFDNLSQSFLSLLWGLIDFDHGQMYAAILMTDFYYAWYFILYVIIVTLLFSNIFVSLILTIMEKFGGRTDITRREFEKILLEQG
jgi:hypothetical protein